MKKSIAMSLAAAAVLSAAGARAAAPAPKKTPELVAKGKASYATNCAACHGDKGLGDGAAAAALDPKPRNLVTGAYRNGTTADQVFATLEKGIAGTTMTAFGHLPAEERWALTYYVLDLRGAKGAKAKK
ncbi:cytochrome c, class I [Anaeromyxobacter sp. K]|uniref:c-type cytochrome n=1 Tax=Anaeromyxobacter sp. (strain K) TaxID=447217 RepID=UPI00015F919A|nr:cytochrome c [Anaeromyxobacter sp. K]ACG72827.1 cytochrome c, class I [Anaeromyxobacter sp. K]